MLKTKLIFLFSLLFFLFPSQAIFADSDKELEVEVARTEVYFPEKITFLFEGKTKKKIQDIKVNFKTGERKTLQYGYMDFIQKKDSDTVSSSMDFRINTQSGFIPPGSKISWSMIFYFDDGSQFITDEQEFIMLDTRFDDWDFVESEKIRIYYRYSKSRANKLLEECDLLLDEMAPIVGSFDEQIRMTLYNNYSEMIDAIRSKSKTSDRELVVAGQAFEESSVVLVLAGRNDIGTATHEIMHILVGRATEGSISLPLWLNEGLAEYANRDKTVSYDLYLDWGIGTNQLKPLSQLLTFPGDPKLTLVAYGQSRSVVNYMIDNYGVEAMNSLLTNLSEGMTVNESILDSYGLELDALDSQWRKSIGAGPYKPRENTTITITKNNPVISDSCRSSSLIILLTIMFFAYKGMSRLYYS
mgnify:CR=1 FL=1